MIHFKKGGDSLFLTKIYILIVSTTISCEIIEIKIDPEDVHSLSKYLESYSDLNKAKQDLTSNSFLIAQVTSILCFSDYFIVQNERDIEIMIQAVNSDKMCSLTWHKLEYKRSDIPNIT